MHHDKSHAKVDPPPMTCPVEPLLVSTDYFQNLAFRSLSMTETKVFVMSFKNQYIDHFFYNRKHFKSLGQIK